MQSESVVTQSCLTFCDPMDCSPPNSPVHEIFQSRTQEWVSTASFGDIPDPGIEPGSPALQVDFLPSEPQGKPKITFLDFLNHLLQLLHLHVLLHPALLGLGLAACLQPYEPASTSFKLLLQLSHVIAFIKRTS